MTSDTASAAALDPRRLATSITRASRALHDVQQPDSHWVFELEADVTIPAEYVMMRHYFAEPVDAEIEAKIAKYLRRMQNDNGGWSLFYGHEFDMSASVKAYYALKMIGDSPDAPHMKKAREAMLARGGASRANVFTRIMLALFGQVSWKAVPMMPVEIMLLPRWFPFHLTKVSYWARTVIVPLLVLMTLKPRAKNPRGIGVRELFLEDPQTVGPTPKAAHQSQLWFTSFDIIDRVLRITDPFFPKGMRKRAIAKAEAFVTERLNGVDGLGAIFPAMVNSIMMYDVLGYPPNDPNRALARESVERLLVIKDDEAYCQPCVSPVWDTALAAHSMLESGEAADIEAAKAGLDWLLPRQVLDLKGDWADKRPDVRPGGWAFQYNNAHYPDLDDTAVVVMAMDRVRRLDGTTKYDEAIARATEWILGLQSENGGWAAFDADNLEYYLNNIPFADHGALLDPPTEDVTARCLSMLAQLGDTLETSEPMRRGVEYLRKTQLPDGSWFGRWGINYVYGTWSVLCALNAVGVPHDDPMIAKAADWLESIQNEDGGWGEDGNSYKLNYKGYERAATTASQTAWATLALMAAGRVDRDATQRGIDNLVQSQEADGFWGEPYYTGGGFPRVFYLRYHGYSKFFPLWAMARYRNLRSSNSRFVGAGM
ncbi:squalene-hopene cyclase [Afipia carboxidovorans OM5]|uniref:Squalene--hopene cyclase Shc n=1 Tax=Afipia carboxidovorans (strain ATCC 49405 / DSM 1227 / KCTC 32145 / OM5) TaxID=504832 RepID=B6JG70_AFIC5|nr:squalene--hopene cyclase [Afipia carboxidovorans]ACI93782.1 squalene-hopene cyclase [Afipia carboxidovorans OM5]AEI02537.1 squalene--hopene cyclase Shc [Afipia carboxidovorans OM4]AEI06113.1 squalene--hopene cyclase Shc [Afipia carboxidovorans OM5]